MTSPTTTSYKPAVVATRSDQIGKQGVTSPGMLARDAERQLRSSPYNGLLRTVSCSEHEDVLILYGRVRSYFEKQQAQEVVRRVPGVREIVNAIEVQ